MYNEDEGLKWRARNGESRQLIVFFLGGSV